MRKPEFTKLASSKINDAIAEASAAGVSKVRTEHLLGEIVDCEQVERVLEALLPDKEERERFLGNVFREATAGASSYESPRDRVRVDSPVFSQSFQKAEEEAKEFARQQGHRYAGVAHLLFGIIASTQAPNAGRDVLISAGVTLDKVIEEVSNLYSDASVIPVENEP